MSTTDSKPRNSKPKNKKKRSNPVFSIVFAVIWGVITGVLWAYANPIQLVPGIIQWRIFAFLPPVIGILFGLISGFISGYLGSVVWGLLAGTFIGKGELENPQNPCALAVGCSEGSQAAVKPQSHLSRRFRVRMSSLSVSV
jgi:hypothetical protein